MEQEHGTKVAEDPASLFVVQHGHRQGQIGGGGRPAATVVSVVVGRLDRVVVPANDSHDHSARHVARPTEHAEHRLQAPATVTAVRQHAPEQPGLGHVVHVLRAVAVAGTGRGRRGPVFAARRVRPVRRPPAAAAVIAVPRGRDAVVLRFIRPWDRRRRRR